MIAGRLPRFSARRLRRLGGQARAALTSEIRPEPLALRAQPVLQLRQGEDMTRFGIHNDAVAVVTIGDDRLAVGARRVSSSESGRHSVREGITAPSGSRPPKTSA
jgi:hypothetical protein